MKSHDSTWLEELDTQLADRQIKAANSGRAEDEELFMDLRHIVSDLPRESPSPA